MIGHQKLYKLLFKRFHPENDVIVQKYEIIRKAAIASLHIFFYVKKKNDFSSPSCLLYVQMLIDAVYSTYPYRASFVVV